MGYETSMGQIKPVARQSARMLSTQGPVPFRARWRWFLWDGRGMNVGMAG